MTTGPSFFPVGEMILDRYERDPAYRFVDTKFSLLTGNDFSDSDPIRGREAIYGWIQARALESLAALGAWVERQAWLAPETRGGLRARIERLLREVLEHMEELRAANGRRLFFLMDRRGRPMRATPEGGVAPQPAPPQCSHEHDGPVLLHRQGEGCGVVGPAGPSGRGQRRSTGRSATI